MTAFFTEATAGLLAGLALIIAIGAQNAYLLRVGICAPRRIIFLAAFTCFLSDVIAISAGVAGFGFIIERFPALVTIMRIGGVLFLYGYGIFSVRRVLHPDAMHIGVASSGDFRAGKVVLTMLAFTWLNPHFYIDTTILLGSLAQVRTHPWWWTTGVLAGSALWFFSLAFAARFLRPLFAQPRAWQILDTIIAVVMFIIGTRLAFGI